MGLAGVTTARAAAVWYGRRFVDRWGHTLLNH
jgi:hypothetical protein